jgi:hypothetical protein
MVVWGGYEAKAGGRFNPLTNHWRPVQATPSAFNRYGHTAVWTGSKMVVFGGFTSEYTNTGGRYDPISDSVWTPTTTVLAPFGRVNQVAIWTGTQMWIWGGYPQTGNTAGGLYQ